jgi:hypothetical protein
MTNTVLIKRSGTANSVPTAGQLLSGELAINYADGNLFFKNSSNVVTTIASNKFVSVTGNVTGNYFIGNGSALTGITASAGASITNGTSNVVVSASSNITANVAGSAIATWASTGEYVTGLISATGNITGGNLNAAGLSLSSNVVSALNLSSSLTAATTVSAVGNITGGNLNAVGLSLSGNVVSALVSAANITTTANIAGNYFIGNGSQLTGIASGGASIANGTSNVNINSSGGNIAFSVNGTANVVTVDNLGFNFADTTTQDTGMNLGRVTTTAQWWNLP